MKALLLCGSPRKKSSTMAAVEALSSELEKRGVSCEIFKLPDSPIAGCNGCRACKETSRCVKDDGIVNSVIEKMLTSDAVVLASPVYYASPNGAFLALLDRVFYCIQNKMSHKVGAAVLCCRRSGATASFDVLNKYFLISNMMVAGSQYWNNVHGNSPEEVLSDEEGLQTMRTLGTNIAYMLSCIEAGKKRELKLLFCQRLCAQISSVKLRI